MDSFIFLEIKSIVMQAWEEDSLYNKYVPHYPKIHADSYVWIPRIINIWEDWFISYFFAHGLYDQLHLT